MFQNGPINSWGTWTVIFMRSRHTDLENVLQVIGAFQLEISEDDLMSRCTKCNGRFIQKPLSTEEAVEAAKGFQRIPSCLFDKNLQFWQCMDCNQLYWEVWFGSAHSFPVSLVDLVQILIFSYCVASPVEKGPASINCTSKKSKTLHILYSTPHTPITRIVPSTSNPRITCVSLLQGTQYHNAVQKFIDVCKLNE